LTLMVYTRTHEQTRRMENSLNTSHMIPLLGLEWLMVWGVLGSASAWDKVEKPLREHILEIMGKIGYRLVYEAILTRDEQGRPCLWPDEQEQKNRGETS